MLTKTQKNNIKIWIGEGQPTEIETLLLDKYPKGKYIGIFGQRELPEHARAWPLYPIARTDDLDKANEIVKDTIEFLKTLGYVEESWPGRRVTREDYYKHFPDKAPAYCKTWYDLSEIWVSGAGKVSSEAHRVREYHAKRCEQCQAAEKEVSGAKPK